MSTSIKSKLDIDFDEIADSNGIDLFEKLSKPSKSVNIKPTLTNNSFYPNLEQVQTRFSTKMTNDLLYKEFGNPYIVCLTDTASYESFYYDQVITTDQREIIRQNITIIPSSYKTITGTAYKYLTTMSADMFNTFNVIDKYNNKITADKDVLLCCLLRFNQSNITKYHKQFNGISNFIDLYNSMLINEYLGQQNNTSTVRQNHIQILNNMAESNYYTIHNNCQLNITLKFKSRGFNLALSERLSDKTVQNVLKRLAESKEDDNNYLAFLFRKSAYLDASSAVNTTNYKLYRITSNPLTEQLTNEHFNALYNKLEPKERYYLIMNAMISKDLCHLVVNNKYIMSKIMSSEVDYSGRTFMQKYAQLIRYTMGYAWLTLYMEESIKRGYINTKDRFIFDIETASMLPWFPYAVDNIHICPYLPVLVERETLNLDKNVLGVMPHYVDDSSSAKLKEDTRYGVCSKEVFIDRVNKFISGKSIINILKNINWSNIAMSGSMMACCLPNFNPLMANFVKSRNTYDVDFNAFVNEYYKDADIDVMCNIKNIYEFVDKIYEFDAQIESNIREVFDSDVKLTTVFSNKSAAVMINKHFIKMHLIKETKMDYVDILSNVNDPVVKKAVYGHYIKWHMENLLQLAQEDPDRFTNPKYHELFLPTPIDNLNVVFIKTDMDKAEDKEEEAKQKMADEAKLKSVEADIVIEEDDKDYEKEVEYEKDDDNYDEYPASNIVFIPKINYKFRISSSYLPHNFELFQIKHDEFFSTVAKFHLPIVRSYYDGTNVYMTPSCVSACMTLLNMDYKYFAGSKDPIEIINKYRMRGFGTILNEREIVRLIEYSNLVPKWKQLYGFSIQSNGSVMRILGHLRLDSNLFKPSKVLDSKDTVYNEYSNINQLNFNEYQVIQNIQRRYGTSESAYNLNHLTTVNKNGFVEPVKKWLFDAFCDYSFNKSLYVNAAQAAVQQ